MTGWRTLKMRDICTLVNGRAYSKDELLPQGRYPVLRVGNFFTNKNWYYSDMELAPDKYCENGDLLYAWSASFGPRIWAGPKVIYHYHIWKVLPDVAVIDQRFLYFFFMWDTERIKQDQGAGTTMIHVAKGSMEDRAVPVPSIAEQHRIVAILDEAFEGIVTAKANAEKNLQNARELFECHLDRLFHRPEKDQSLTRLADLCEIKHGYAFDGANFSVDNGAQAPVLLTPGNFSEDGRLQFSGKSTKYYTGTDVPPGYVLEVGDLVVVMTDLSSKMKILGKPATVDRPNLLHNQRIGRVVNLQPRVATRYLYYFMRTGGYVLGIRRTATGTMVRHTAPTRILDAVLPLPSIEKQAEVIRALEEVEEQVLTLERNYRRRIAVLDQLRQSLLYQAFTGALTANSAENQVAELA
jgi:type I restriction enzyme S subunit